MADLITKTYVINQVKKILPIDADDTTMYDNQLDILVSGAINKLRTEGVDIEAKDKDGEYIFTEGEYASSDYVICIGYQIMKDLDYDVDMNFMTEQYITRIGTLRCYLLVKQH